MWELPSGRANEALDCRVYAYAALCGLTHLGLKLNRRAIDIETNPSVLRPPEEISGVIVTTQEPTKKVKLSSLLA